MEASVNHGMETRKHRRNKRTKSVMMVVTDGLSLLWSKGIRKVVRRLAKRMEKLKPIGRRYDSFTTRDADV